MAGVLGTLSAAAIACTSVAKTVLQIIPAANHRAKINSWGVAFDGVSGTGTPILVELVRQTDGGTASGVTAQKVNPDDSETLQTTGGSNATVEPTGSVVIDRQDVHPQGGYRETFPFGQEIHCQSGARIGIRITAPQNVNCIPYIKFEE